MNKGLHRQAWYRQVWPWVLILIPFTAVLFGIFMITVATNYPDDLVVDDYYKDGMAINRSLEMDNRADEMGIVAHLELVGADRIGFIIEGASDSAVVLNIRHVTDRSQDKKVLLLPDENNLYVSRPDENATYQMAMGSKGVWYLDLEGVDSHWRLKARIETPVTALTMSAP
ncbi:MAG: FixH family protein [Pseudomonadales bacterium]